MDEFAAAETARRIVDIVGDTPFDIGAGGQLPVTVSAGLATLPSAANSADTLMAAADKALYAAKDGGRNRVEVASILK
tara:strand:- start:1782 stop:2015 length:234 start_codon:yes stop_codon:yes gene_type:complete